MRSAEDVAREFVREQSRGEWGDAVEAADAQRLATLIRRSREEGARWALEAAAKIASFSCRIHGDTVTLTAEAIRAIDPAGAAGEGGTNAD